MVLACRSLRDLVKSIVRPPRTGELLLGIVVGAVALGCGSDTVGVEAPPEVATISIDTPAVQLERGTHKVFTATAKDAKGKIVLVPFVWRSSDENVAKLDLNGRLTAVGEGTASITASALGVSSPGVGVRVVWQGAAKLAAFGWTAPSAATPSTAVGDSIRVAAVSRSGAAAPGTIVAFAVTGGGGTLSATKVTTDSKGIAAVQWTLGPNVGANTLTATVVDDDGNPVSWVDPNTTTFSVTTFNALNIVAGGSQSATILSSLPVAPSVRLVDAAGKPRQGVPVTFLPGGGGEVAFPVVSTGADGVASPGTWTLGDVPGDQVLVATVESAKITLHANATGTPIHYFASQVSAGGSATCALSTEGLASCWGLAALIGDADSLSRTVPTPTAGDIVFKSISAGLSHVCGLATDESLYCWGFNAFADTSGKTIGVLRPTRLATDLKWTTVTTGIEHTCAIATDQIPYCWGINSRGQLGIAVADTLLHFVPQPVYGGFKFSSIAAGAAHTCALTVDRTAFCWGWNQNGQLGDGSFTSRVAPTVVSGTLTFQSIGAGELWTCGLTPEGKVYCWGVIPGVSNGQPTPLGYPSAPTFSSLSVGGTHACALTSDGSAYCWGGNSSGQLGDSTSIVRTAPTKVAGNFKFKSISAGDTHTCGILTDNSVVCWGLNRFGEIGDAKAAFRLSPRYIVLGVNP